MTANQAGRFHVLKMGLVDDIMGQANHALNPSPRCVTHMRQEWLKAEHGGLDNLSMADCIKKYVENNPDVTILEDITEGQFIAVLVTSFMKRVHLHFREAGEIVFVDGTGCVDQLNTSVVPLLCAGPAGAAPLAVLFTSSQDEAALTKGKSDNSSINLRDDRTPPVSLTLLATLLTK